MRQKKYFVILLSICFGLYIYGYFYEYQLINSSVIWISNKVGDVLAKNMKNKHNVRTVLVVAYMRSGSSLTGELLDQANGSIYYYEPIRPFFKPHTEPNTGNITHLKRTRDIKIQVLNAWLSCSFNGALARTLYYSLKTWCQNCQEYFKCVGDSSTSFLKIHLCLPLLVNLCKKANVRIAKVIRLEMKLVSELLISDPNLRVVHLLRDPRGILNSRLRLGVFNKKNSKIVAATLCQNMHNNIREYLKLKENPQFRHRMMTVFYEDLGEYPIAISKEMFSFLEIPFTVTIRKWIKANMLGTTNRNGNPFSVLHRNSHLHVNSWRSKLSYGMVSVIDESCQNLYEISGYNKVDSNDQLRNMDVKLFNQSSI
ncbi:carbohydrate sulfotransferase 1-like [Argonauta hians]